MAKKSQGRAQPLHPRQQSAYQAVAQRRWRLKLVIGGVVLALVLGVGVVVRFLPRHPAPHLQGAVDRHYTRGTAGAPVVIKEFSDYT
jgi:hypothetical protein